MLAIARDISVIICSFTEERWHELTQSIESIQRQTVSPREIIVVIDHNIRLFELAREHFPGISIIESSEPTGLSGARNSGIALSHGNLVAFLDDDAVAEPNWLERLSDCCQNPNVLGAGGVVRPLWSYRRPAWFPEEFNWVIGCTYEHLSDTPMVVRNPYGGCTCIRREVFEVVGGFRNGLGRVGYHPMGGEETELCLRAAQHWPNKNFLCDPGARIHHHISIRRASWSYFCSRCYCEGVSKAKISRCIGVKTGLSTERFYVSRTLSWGVLRSINQAIFHLELSGLLQVGAIVAGLALTILGFMVGMLTYNVQQDQENNFSLNSLLQAKVSHE